MDIRQLLGKLDLIEGSMKAAEKHPTGPKFTGQWKGKDKGTPGTKMVGGMEESILKDLNKGPTPKTKEQELAEQFEQFLQALEEENLGVADKRPARKGSRPARDMGKTGEPSKRYKTIKESVDDLLTSFREGWRDIEQTDIYHTETKKVMKRFYDLMRNALMQEDLDQFWWAYEKFSSDYPDAFVNFLDDCGLGSIDEIKSLLTLNEDEYYPPKNDGGRSAKSAQKWTEDDMWSLQNNLVNIDGLQDSYIARLEYHPNDNKYSALMKFYEPQGKRKYVEINFDIDSGGSSHYPVDVDFDRLYGDSIYLGGFNDQEEFIPEAIKNPRKVITQKLQDIERSKNPEAPADDLTAREARAKAEYAKYVAKMKAKNPDYIPMYKVDEAGANNPPQNTSPQQQQMAKNVAQGTQALKAATGASAPTDVLAKAIDTASQGNAIDAKSAQALEPMMGVLKQAAQDPNLANQFKSFASQAKTSAARQLNQQRKP